MHEQNLKEYQSLTTIAGTWQYACVNVSRNVCRRMSVCVERSVGEWSICCAEAGGWQLLGPIRGPARVKPFYREMRVRRTFVCELYRYCVELVSANESRMIVNGIFGIRCTNTLAFPSVSCVMTLQLNGDLCCFLARQFNFSCHLSSKCLIYQIQYEATQWRSKRGVRSFWKLCVFHKFLKVNMLL